MTTNPECSTCHVQMSKVGTLQSGNASYETYRCQTCHEEKSVCLGIGK